MNRQSAEDEKKARLAAALRENLRRRKAQARGRLTQPAPRDEAAPPAKADSDRS